MLTFRYKGLTLPHDTALLVSTLVLIAYFGLLLKLYPLKKVVAIGCRSIGRKGVEKSGEERARESESCGKPSEIELLLLDKSYRLTTFYLRRIFRSSRPCLRRSLILYRHCCRLGICAKLIVGVKKENGELKSHAWLEIDGAPFREPSHNLANFTPILES